MTITSLKMANFMVEQLQAENAALKAELAAAPKPAEPTIKEALTVAEPVAQEPVAEVVPYNGPSGSRVALYAEHKNLPIGTKLYLAPPDQSAFATA